MSQNVINEYVSFCNEYQRQMREIIQTYSDMNRRLETILNNANSDLVDINQRSENNENNDNNDNNDNNNNQIRTRFQQFSINQPLIRTNINSVPLGSLTQPINGIRNGNVTTTTLFTTLDNASMNDINALLNTNLNTGFGDLFGNIFTNILNPSTQNLENVVVRPSNEQIENATELVQYNTIENASHDSCPIGLTPFNDNDEVMRIKQCGHFFNEENLRSWFQQSVRCPLCRYDIRDYVEEPETENDEVERNITTTSDMSNNYTIDSALEDALDEVITNNGL
jgi:hypothetical protein